MQVTNKQFALIAICILGILQLTAYYLGFDGQFTILITGVITYLVGVVTGQQVEKKTVNAQNEVIEILAADHYNGTNK